MARSTQSLVSEIIRLFIAASPMEDGLFQHSLPSIPESTGSTNLYHYHNYLITKATGITTLLLDMGVGTLGMVSFYMSYVTYHHSFPGPNLHPGRFIFVQDVPFWFQTAPLSLPKHIQHTTYQVYMDVN